MKRYVDVGIGPHSWVSSMGSSLVGIVGDGALLGSLWERLYQKQLASWLDKQIRAIGPDPGR